MAIKFDKGSAIGTISLTPLIDIVFLLLIFFLVATEFAKEEREMKVVLPSASEAKPLTSKPSELSVNILSDGTFIVNREVVDVHQLEDFLRQASVNNPGRQRIVIRGDRNCNLEHAVAVMNVCNKVNISDYTIAIAKPARL